MTANDAESYIAFGSAVSISGDTIIVGAHMGEGVTRRSGAAYVYKRAGSVWEFSQKLFAPSSTGSDEWGRAVSISGDMIVVGAPSGNGGMPYGSGTADVFRRTGPGWTLLSNLMPADPARQDWIGGAVATDGTRAIVGSSGDDAPEHAEGSAHVFLLGPAGGARHWLAY